MRPTTRDRAAASASHPTLVTRHCTSNRHTPKLLEMPLTYTKQILGRISNRHRYTLFFISNRHTSAFFLPFAPAPTPSSGRLAGARSLSTSHSPVLSEVEGLLTTSRCPSNRQTPPELEMPLTHTKQTLRPFSNRQCFRIFLRTLSPHRRNGKRAADVANADSLR